MMLTLRFFKMYCETDKTLEHVVSVFSYDARRLSDRVEVEFIIDGERRITILDSIGDDSPNYDLCYVENAAGNTIDKLIPPNTEANE